MSYSLSIIVPFYNSEGKSQCLLDTLCKIEFDDIEIILVDDGSTDNTLNMLKSFKQKSKIKTSIITQENKGPGGARNTGLKQSKAKYVWFVDSDDDINPDAIPIFRKYFDEDYDLFDFNIKDMHQSPQQNNKRISSDKRIINEDEARKILLKDFGQHWSKIFKKDILIRNKLFYPEYCYYEDTPFPLYFPFFFKTIVRFSLDAYTYNNTPKSIVKSGINPRYFDRLWTLEWGFKQGVQLVKDDIEKMTLYKKFIKLYLFNSSGMFMPRHPSRKWIVAMRIMKQFRRIIEELNIESNPFDYLEGSALYKTKFKTVWHLSYLLPDESTYFSKIRMEAWGKEFIPPYTQRC